MNSEHTLVVWIKLKTWSRYTCWSIDDANKTHSFNRFCVKSKSSFCHRINAIVVTMVLLRLMMNPTRPKSVFIWLFHKYESELCHRFCRCCDRDSLWKCHKKYNIESILFGEEPQYSNKCIITFLYSLSCTISLSLSFFLFVWVFCRR